MGYTNSFSGKNDYDHFIMRVNSNLELDYIRMLVNDVTDEFIYSMVLSKYQYYQMGCGVISTKDTRYNDYGLIVRWDENGGFAHVEFGNWD